MTKNLKDLIDEGFFRENAAGQPLVPRRGFSDLPDYKFPDVAIITTEGPGDYPIIGYADGDAMQFDVNGNMRGHFGPFVFEDGDREANSLVMPEKVELSQFVTYDPESRAVTSGGCDTWDEAARMICGSEIVVELKGEAYAQPQE